MNRRLIVARIGGWLHPCLHYNIDLMTQVWEQAKTIPLIEAKLNSDLEGQWKQNDLESVGSLIEYINSALTGLLMKSSLIFILITWAEQISVVKLKENPRADSLSMWWLLNTILRSISLFSFAGKKVYDWLQ
jgi:hypothetical protein